MVVASVRRSFMHYLRGGGVEEESGSEEDRTEWRRLTRAMTKMRSFQSSKRSFVSFLPLCELRFSCHSTTHTSSKRQSFADSTVRQTGTQFVPSRRVATVTYDGSKNACCLVAGPFISVNKIGKRSRQSTRRGSCCHLVGEHVIWITDFRANVVERKPFLSLTIFEDALGWKKRIQSN